MKISTFSQRLREAMYIRRLNQTDLHSLTGIGKSSISTYLKGDYKAKQDKVDLLAKVLSVSPAWLMGYDVPMESVRPFNSISPSASTHGYLSEPQIKYNLFSDKQKEILDLIQDFSEEQLSKLVEYILFLKSL